MQMYRLFIFITLVFVSAAAGAQEELFDGPVVITRNLKYGGIHLHTNGYGAFFNYGWNKGAYKMYMLGIDGLVMKHEKEVKSFNPIYDDSKSYVYGKTNNLYIFRPTLGVKKILTEKLRSSGVQVGYIFQFGPSLGITKPIYLEIGYPSIPYEYLSVEKYDPSKHYFDDIYGRASGLNGLEELKLYPGAFAKFAFTFEYSNEKYGLKGMEVGAAADFYSRRIPIMAENFIDKNKQLFFNFYLNLFIGSKFNKNG
jgi:hypothetical protein